MGAIKERLRPWYLRNIYFRAFPMRKPSWFEDCWRFPHAPLGCCEHLLDPPTPGSRDFLMLPMTDWHVRIQRSHFLAQALAARGHRCFLLNPHLGREFGSTAVKTPQLARLEANIYELHIRLPREPVYHHRSLTWDESEMLAGGVADLIASAQISNFVQIVSFPVWLRLALFIKKRCNAAIVYDCHDLLAGFENVAPEIVALERGLIAASDLVICSAESLYKECLDAGVSADRCSIVRNAVSERLGRPIPVAPHSGPIVGYLGAIENWFDSEAIRTAAVARPGWRFVLGGRIESRNLQPLQDLPNVEFAGEIGRDRVADFLAGFDVATIPFLLNPLTVAADPIKLYEYFSAGLPVVSARLPETRRFSGHLHYYDGPGDFVHAVEKALADRDESARSRRRLAVVEETWELRAGQILHLTEPLLWETATPRVGSSLDA